MEVDDFETRILFVGALSNRADPPFRRFEVPHDRETVPWRAGDASFGDISVNSGGAATPPEAIGDTRRPIPAEGPDTQPAPAPHTEFSNDAGMFRSTIRAFEVLGGVAVASGWFADPYGRHEARWISAGTPTALVRDGNVEHQDLPPEQPHTFSSMSAPAPSSDPRSGSDLRRADDANRQPLPDDERYKTMASDTLMRPVLFPVPGMEQDYDTPAASRRRTQGFFVLVFGVAMIMAGYFLAQRVPDPAQRSFVPSQTELNVLRTGGTADPPDCSGSARASAPDAGDGTAVVPTDAGTQFTVYPRSVVTLNGGRYTSEISASAPAPACLLDVDYGAPGYYLERPGKMTVYFIGANNHVSVVSIVITGAAPPSSAPWDALMVLGLLVSAFALFLLYRRLSDHQPGDDLRRADDGGRQGVHSAQGAERAAMAGSH